MAVSHAVIRVQDPLSWINALTWTQALQEIAVMAFCVAAALVFTVLLRRATQRWTLSILLGEHALDGVFFPVCLWLLL